MSKQVQYRFTSDIAQKVVNISVIIPVYY